MVSAVFCVFLVLFFFLQYSATSVYPGSNHSHFLSDVSVFLSIFFKPTVLVVISKISNGLESFFFKSAWI